MEISGYYSRIGHLFPPEFFLAWQPVHGIFI